MGKERDGSDDRVDGGETVGNSLGRARVFRTTPLSRKIAPKTFRVVCNRWAMGHA